MIIRALRTRLTVRDLLTVLEGDVSTKGIVKVLSEARRQAYRLVGQWNSVEIVSKDGQVKSCLNGLLLSRVTEREFKEAGYLAFQSGGAGLHWRSQAE